MRGHRRGDTIVGVGRKASPPVGGPFTVRGTRNRCPRITLEACRHGGGNDEAGMADMVPVTITGVVRGTDDGPERRERFFIELAASGADARPWVPRNSVVLEACAR